MNNSLYDAENQNSLSRSEIKELLGERFSRVIEMRLNGETFKKIGMEIGVSPCRASQIYQSAERKLRRLKSDEGWFEKLPARVANCISMAGIKTEEECRAAIVSGELTAKGKYMGRPLNGFGKKSFTCVCKRLNISPHDIFNSDDQTTLEIDMHLHQIDHLKTELKNMRKTLWAIIISNGGKLKIDVGNLMRVMDDNKIETWTEDHGHTIWYKAH